MMPVGTCHCGRVTITLDGAPDEVTDCNCSNCYKHGSRWGYFSPPEVRIGGETAAYIRADANSPATILHFCRNCGCTTHWSATDAYVRHAGSDDRMGVNMLLFDSELLVGVAVRKLDGQSWDVDEEWPPRPPIASAP